MRFGLVGLGWAAHGFHLPALATVPGASVVGGVDLDAAARERFAKTTGAATFESVDELLSVARPDVVVVGTPPDSHHALCLQSLAAGAHVLCEKPFVETTPQADEVIAAAADAGRGVAVNHEFRFKPAFRAVAERVGEPDVGRLVFTQIWQLMDLAPWDEPTPWRAAMPNRTLFEGGVHLLDLLATLYREQPEAVYARHQSDLDGKHQADAIHLLTLEYPGNRLAQITIDRLCPAGTRYVELRADCEQVSLRASEGGRAVLQIGMKRAQRAGARLMFGLGGVAWEERGLRRRTLARNPRNPGVPATAQLFREVSAAFAAGDEPPCSAREARDGLAIVEAAYRSAATGERVAVGRAP